MHAAGGSDSVLKQVTLVLSTTEEIWDFIFLDRFSFPPNLPYLVLIQIWSIFEFVTIQNGPRTEK